MGEIVDVASIVTKKKSEIKKKIEQLKNKNIVPKLAVILANDNEASLIYVGKKKKMCEELGIDYVEYILDKEVTDEKIIEIIQRLNEDESVDGIIVQLPLFKHLNEKKILNEVDYRKDVDGFSAINIGNLVIGQDSIHSCTPKGVMMILDELVKDYNGLNAVVVGRSVIVRKAYGTFIVK